MNIKVFVVGIVLLVIPLVFLLTGGSLPFVGRNKKAGLYIETTPKAEVFLNDIQQGSTPFDREDLKAQEYKIRLEPEGDLLPWEGRVTLVAGRKTVISREFATSEDLSSGFSLTLEQTTDKEKASLTIITNPDSSVVSLDGEPRGFSPLTINNLEEGSHILLIFSPGFKEKKQEIQLISGFRLNASIKLAKLKKEKEIEKEEEATESAQKKEDAVEEATTSSTPGKTISEGSYVTIKETGTGWLRVRSEPIYKADNSNEVAKINVGDDYKLLDETENGWYKIEYEDDKSGWISGKYAEKYED